MEIKMIKIEDLKPYANNPRFNDDSVEYVAKSIKEFGFKVPMVIDKNNEIVAGHTRYKASLELGLKEVPCIVADDLNEEQIKAFRLADNKVSEQASWNYDLLDIELDDIKGLDMSEFGFLKFNEDLSYLDDLKENPFAGTSENNIFSITFNFDKKYEEVLTNYIKNNSKKEIEDKIIEMVVM